MVFDDLVSLLRELGQPVSSQRLPSTVLLGPFNFIVDLGTALTVQQDVTNLLQVANVEDPGLGILGFTANSPEIGFLLWGAKLLLGGTSTSRLNPTDMAHLNSNLHIRFNTAGQDQYRSLSGAVGRQGVQVQELQAMAANATNYADAEPKPVIWSQPLYIPTLKSARTFSLYNQAARTFTTPADPDLSKLLLYGAAFQTTSITGAPGTKDCGEVAPAVAQALSLARLTMPPPK
jgi:hypothetical protein